MSNHNLHDCVRASIESYFRDLDGTDPAGLHDMLVKAVEKPLLEVVMQPPLVVVDEDGGADVHGVHQAQPLLDAALAQAFLDLGDAELAHHRAQGASPQALRLDQQQAARALHAPSC